MCPDAASERGPGPPMSWLWSIAGLSGATTASIWSGTERTQHSDGVRPSALSATRVWPPGKAMAGGSGLASTFMTLASLRSSLLKNQKPTRSPTRKPAAEPEVIQ